MTSEQEVKNDLVLRALRCQSVPRTPVWFMRQAGRYLPEYNRVRQAAGSFLALCKTPELAAEVTLQPVERFDLDAAIVFSDILTIPDAMGLELCFKEGEGPILNRPVRDEKTIHALKPPDPQALEYVMQAIAASRRALQQRVPLIGFSGSPYTLACYMVEGRSPGDFFHLKSLRYQRADLLHHLLAIMTEAVSNYLVAQVAAGAQIIMLFDSWGGSLSEADFAEFSLAYVQQIMRRLEQHAGQVPRILFVKGGGQWLPQQAQCGAHALGIDWTVSLASARRRLAGAGSIALQGNLDPLALLGTPREVQRQTASVLADYGSGPGHVFNLGHGIHQHTPLVNVEAMLKALGK